jgi:hypothetical protein
VPGGPALVGQAQPQQEGLQPEPGGLEVLHGVFAGAAHVADRFVLDGGDVDGGEVPGAKQPGELDGVAAVGLHPVAGLLGEQGGGDDHAGDARGPEIAVKDVAAGAGLVGDDQGGRLARPPAQQRVDVRLAGAEGPDAGDVGGSLLGGVGDGDGVLVDVEPDIQRGRRRHG